jgi:hypothetical protein
MLYALQSSTIRPTTFEPKPTQVAIDGSRPIGITAGSTVEGREFDDVNDKIEEPG